MSADAWRVVMPETGWDRRAVTFFCPQCAMTLTHHSDYLNLDALLDMGFTQAEFFLCVHQNDHHPEVFQ